MLRDLIIHKNRNVLGSAGNGNRVFALL